MSANCKKVRQDDKLFWEWRRDNETGREAAGGGGQGGEA